MLSPGTLFVGSLLFATVVRTFSFGSLAIFSLSSVSIPDTDSLNSADPVTRFYVSALDVLLATGDFVSLNTYLFLVVLWVDIAQKARQHFLSTRRLRCGWMTGYLSFSVFTYILSFVLFILHFVSSANSTTYLDAIYYSLAIFDVLVPFLLAVVYIYSLCALAGFPYTSEAARKRMVQVWSTAQRSLPQPPMHVFPGDENSSSLERRPRVIQCFLLFIPWSCVGDAGGRTFGSCICCGVNNHFFPFRNPSFLHHPYVSISEGSATGKTAPIIALLYSPAVRWLYEAHGRSLAHVEYGGRRWPPGHRCN